MKKTPAESWANSRSIASQRILPEADQISSAGDLVFPLKERSSLSTRVRQTSLIYCSRLICGCSRQAIPLVRGYKFEQFRRFNGCSYRSAPVPVFPSALWNGRSGGC